jgi:hypothetical protein
LWGNRKGLDVDGRHEWFLAFDGSCGTCRSLAEVVARACGPALNIRSLDDEDVSRWRRTALGSDAPWAPTLIRVRGEMVRAWTGPGMAVRLAWRLGPRTTVRLLRTFGELSSRSSDPTGAREGMARKDFLRFAAGAAAAAGLVAFGKTPAFADPVRRAQRADAWVAANLDKLPRDYDGFAPFDVTYRRAIYQVLPASDRGRLWAEHLKRRGAGLSPLSAEQASVLDRAMALAGDERNFTAAGGQPQHASLEQLRTASIAAFGLDEARALLTTLGPEPVGDAGTLACPACNCATASDWCLSTCCRGWCGYSYKNCECSYNGGCGTFWSYDCNGHCGSPGCPSYPVCA